MRNPGPIGFGLAILSVGVVALLQQRHVETEVTPRPIFYLVADAERQFERIPLRLTRVSLEEEMRVGRELTGRVRFSTGPAGPDEIERQRYIERMGLRLVEGVERRRMRYQFHYVASSRLVNAFALPGGQIFVGEGFFGLFDSEDALAAVLGHEIAHVDRRHCIERFQYELASRKLGLDVFYRMSSFPIRIFQQGYSKEQEYDADRVGLRLSVEAGYSPAGALEVMRKFEELNRRAVRAAGSPAEEVARLPWQSLVEYFRSHPPPRDRLAALEREILARGWDAGKPTRPLKSRLAPTAPEAR